MSSCWPLLGEPSWCPIYNSSSPGQNGHHFADDIFKYIFMNENVCITISLKFVPKRPINNIPELFQIMAWRRIGDKPLSETMLTQFTDAYMRHHPGALSLTHLPRDKMAVISQTTFSNTFSWMKMYVLQFLWSFVPKRPINNIPELFQIMAWRRIGDKPLYEPMLTQFTDAYMRHQGEMS